MLQMMATRIFKIPTPQKENLYCKFCSNFIVYYSFSICSSTILYYLLLHEAEYVHYLLPSEVESFHQNKGNKRVENSYLQTRKNYTILSTTNTAKRHHRINTLCVIFMILVSLQNVKKCVLGGCTITSKAKINVF